MFRTILLIGASAMALAATSAEALTFAYTGTIQHYTVATTGIYNVVAAGAHGGSYYYGQGGQGIAIGAHVSLTAGTLLDIIVGGGGEHGGGGGGSFVLAGLASPVVIGGGGGGGGYFDNGTAATAARNGTNGGGTSAGSGGSGGAGGLGGTYANSESGGGSGFNGGGGGGLNSAGGDGQHRASGGGGSGAPSFAGGLYNPAINPQGYYRGGFGGGGAAGGFGGSGGGGGGSFTRADATDLSATANLQADGNGFASIDLIPSTVPEPATWGLLTGGFGMIGAAMRRRKRRLA